MIDFSLTDELQEYQDRARAFIRDKIIPMESDPRQSPHGPSDELRLEVAALGREAGLLTPHIGEEWGGLGLPHIGKAIVFEEAGYSPLGAYALNISAPDEGNMHLLEVVGSEEQKEKYLRPLAAADIRSAFSMTEPDGGAGSDPSMMKVTAVENDDGYVINGRKWMITGADGAAFQIIMARTIDKSGEDIGATMFMADMDIEGCEVVRVLDTMDSNTSGGHSIVDYNDVRVSKESILGEAGKGFRYAQVRLAPARLTHCMRWLGLARRCVEIATEYASRREGFGVRLADRESVQIMLGTLCADIEVGRLLVMKAAWGLDQGSYAQKEVSMAKVHVANLLHRAADAAIQINGARGYSKDTVLEWIYRYARQARLVDGADEVHQMVLNRYLASEGRAFFHWPIAEA